MRTPRSAVLLICTLGACQNTPDRQTIAALDQVTPDTTDVAVDDGLQRALNGYTEFLAATPDHIMAPEAMRRMADLKLERDVGYIGAPSPAPVTAEQSPQALETAKAIDAFDRVALEARAAASTTPAVATSEALVGLPDPTIGGVGNGPAEAIATYNKILETYPWYERNDQVLYQLARAHDELAQPEQAMAVADRLIAQYPESRYLSEVLFRRGEFHFVRRDFQDAERAYAEVVQRGPDSAFYELSLYKLGWAFYKQDLYEEALDRYLALLDHKRATGYDFDSRAEEDEEDERRIADTFRVISLSFSNLGGPNILEDYFARVGPRPYEDRIYRNLAEFHLSKRRFNDAAATYEAFVTLHSQHRAAPDFSRSTIDVYHQGNFPLLVVEAKRNYALHYRLDGPYWQHFDPADRAPVVDYLESNLVDLANHYHTLYRDETITADQPANFEEAQRWYTAYLDDFAGRQQAPQIHYQLADLLREAGKYRAAAAAYEQTAYGYSTHERAAEAGYAAVYAHREHVKATSEAERFSALQATIDSSLRFANAFPAHEQAATVLAAATQDLYGTEDFVRAIAAGRQHVSRYPDAPADQLRASWMIVAHASFELDQYADAETAYGEVLERTAEDDEDQQKVVDNLAAAIYRQGEVARDAADYEGAAQHFLRISTVAPTAAIRAGAEYDAAAAYVLLEAWERAATVLESFRNTHPENDLVGSATQQLAHVLEQSGDLPRAAEEHERVAATSESEETARQALLAAGDLYEQASARDRAVRVYNQYVNTYSEPVHALLEIRHKLAGFHHDAESTEARDIQLRAIVALDAGAGAERTERTRYLAAGAALQLLEPLYHSFTKLKLTQPFAESLTAKQKHMDSALKGFEALLSYEIAEVTAAATYYRGEIFRNFSDALLASERPPGLTEQELLEYQIVLEEEAEPFDDRALAMHEDNLKLLRRGLFNDWTQRSVTRLAELLPARYARAELSPGFLGSLERYAYRAPGAPAADSEREPGPAPEAGETIATFIPARVRQVQE